MTWHAAADRQPALAAGVRDAMQLGPARTLLDDHHPPAHGQTKRVPARLSGMLTGQRLGDRATAERLIAVGQQDDQRAVGVLGLGVTAGAGATNVPLPCSVVRTP